MQITSKKWSTRETALRLLWRVAIDGTLGATCGGLYGLVFGGFGALIHGEPWKLVSIAVYFAGWGFALGALVAAYGALFSIEGDAVKPTPSSQDFVEKKPYPIEAVRHLMAPSPHAAQNGLTSATQTDRKRTQTVGT